MSALAVVGIVISVLFVLAIVGGVLTWAADNLMESMKY